MSVHLFFFPVLTVPDSLPALAWDVISSNIAIFVGSNHLLFQGRPLPRELKMGHSFTPWSLRPGEAVGYKPALLCRRMWSFFRCARRIDHSSTVTP